MCCAEVSAGWSAVPPRGKRRARVYARHIALRALNLACIPEKRAPAYPMKQNSCCTSTSDQLSHSLAPLGSARLVRTGKATTVQMTPGHASACECPHKKGGGRSVAQWPAPLPGSFFLFSSFFFLRISFSSSGRARVELGASYVQPVRGRAIESPHLSATTTCSQISSSRVCLSQRHRQCVGSTRISCASHESESDLPTDRENQ